MRNKIYQCVKECYKEKFPKTWEAKTKELWDEAKKETDLQYSYVPNCREVNSQGGWEKSQN